MISCYRGRRLLCICACFQQEWQRFVCLLVVCAGVRPLPHYCVSCTSMRYYWEKALLLIVKNVGACDCSVRLYMSSNIFLHTGVFYLFKLVGGGVFENICGE